MYNIAPGREKLRDKMHENWTRLNMTAKISPDLGSSQRDRSFQTPVTASSSDWSQVLVSAVNNLAAEAHCLQRVLDASCRILWRKTCVLPHHVDHVQIQDRLQFRLEPRTRDSISVTCCPKCHGRNPCRHLRSSTQSLSYSTTSRSQ